MTDDPPVPPERTGLRHPALRTAGLAALILLAPGGFVLGATLAARALRKRAAARET